MEDTYDMNCRLYLDMPADKALNAPNAPDRFLRQVWLERCGRLSVFQDAGKSIKAGRFSAGDQFLRLYDMGDTAETLITVTGTTWRKPQRETVHLLDRNVPLHLSAKGREKDVMIPLKTSPLQYAP